ncbi:MAG: DNA repair protein RadA, partial [Acidobacteria bacterium]
VIFGEVGLAGEIRGVSDSETRVKEAKKLGFKRVILPASNSSALKKNNDVRLTVVNSLEEAILKVFNG